jgi:hypothetical protein
MKLQAATPVMPRSHDVSAAFFNASMERQYIEPWII